MATPPARADILVVDNYDSFTHNAVDLLRQLGAAVVVRRNDHPEAAPARVAGSGVRGVVLSPGPGRPRGAGRSVALVRALGSDLPILGICLGLHVIAQAYGGRIVPARRPLHGTATPIHHDGAGLLRGLPRPFPAARYHSLVVDPERLPPELIPTARSDEGDLMGLRHVEHPVEGVQFHPESFLTPAGPRIFEAFLRRAGLRPAPAAGVVR